MTAEDGRGLDDRALLRRPGATRRAGDAVWPQVDVESGLKPRDGAEVWPGCAVQDRSDRGVVHPGGIADGSQTAPAHRRSQGIREATGDFDGRVVAFPVRPTVGDLGRQESTGAGHNRNVARRRLTLVLHAGDVGGEAHDVDSKQQPEAVDLDDPPGERVARRIAAYDPKIPAEQWAAIEEFVRAAFTDFSPPQACEAGYFLTLLTRHVHWCWTQGYPLDREVIFRREVISESIAKGMAERTNKTQATIRSRLFRMSEQLMTGPHRPVRVPTIPIGPAQAPYSPREVTLLRTWASNLNTDYRRINMTVILALGLGAGLKAHEMSAMTCGDVTVDDEGVLVHVRAGTSPRTVPVLEQWEETLAVVAAAAMRSEQWLMLPKRRLAQSSNMLPNFTLDLPNRPVSVRAQRLRATWIVDHLSAGTPVGLLAQAAGMDSASALGPYITHVPNLDPVAGRQMLRAAAKGRS